MFSSNFLIPGTVGVAEEESPKRKKAACVCYNKQERCEYLIDDPIKNVFFSVCD